MRLFSLLNFQHVILYVFPTLMFILIFASALGFIHFDTRDAQARKSDITYRFADDLRDRNAPFPLVMTLVIIGTAVWAFLYILITGLSGVKI